MKKYRETMRYAAHAFDHGVRVMAALDIGRARTQAQELHAQISANRNLLAEHAQNGTGTEQELAQLRNAIAADAQRYSDLMGALRMEEERQGASVAAQFNQRQAQAVQDARGGYFRALMTGAQPDAQIMAALSLPITTGANPGNGLLPITISNQLIDDIYDDTGILSEITVTQIKGLRIPKISAVDDENDAATPAGSEAHSITINDPEILTWGRFPGRDKILVPSALLRGTNTSLDGYITAKLREVHRKRMCRRLFAAAAAGDYAHMSVYDTSVVNVKAVSAATELDAIMAALADLQADVRAVAKVVMTPAKWFALIKELTNASATLFGKPDEAALGFKVVLCDWATTTLVGDLKTIHANYDDPLSMKSDEDIDLDVTKVVVGGDYDIQIEEPHRLRKVTVSA